MPYRPRKKSYHKGKTSRCKRCGAMIRRHIARCKKCGESAK